jgi:hypothetical protein
MILDMTDRGGTMSYEEKGTWAYLAAVAGAYAVYLAIILGRLQSIPATEVSYAWVLLWTTVASVVLALAKVDYFWIANIIYLGFVLWAIVGSAVKLVAYRRGL